MNDLFKVAFILLVVMVASLIGYIVTDEGSEEESLSITGIVICSVGLVVDVLAYFWRAA